MCWVIVCWVIGVHSGLSRGPGAVRAPRRTGRCPQWESCLGGGHGTLSTVCLQRSPRWGPDAGPNEFNLVAGYFFFPLIRHFDR